MANDIVSLMVVNTVVAQLEDTELRDRLSPIVSDALMEATKDFGRGAFLKLPLVSRAASSSLRCPWSDSGTRDGAGTESLVSSDFQRARYLVPRVMQCHAGCIRLIIDIPVTRLCPPSASDRWDGRST